MGQLTKQQIIDGLQAENAELRTQLEKATAGTLTETVQEEAKAAKEELEAARVELANTKAELETANAQVKSLEAQLAEANEAIATLAAGTSTGSAAAATAVVFEHGGEKFGISRKVSIPKLGSFTPDQVAENAEAQAWLVNNNSPLITRQSNIAPRD